MAPHACIGVDEWTESIQLTGFHPYHRTSGKAERIGKRRKKSSSEVDSNPAPLSTCSIIFTKRITHLKAFVCSAISWHRHPYHEKSGPGSMGGYLAGHLRAILIRQRAWSVEIRSNLRLTRDKTDKMKSGSRKLKRTKKVLRENWLLHANFPLRGFLKLNPIHCPFNEVFDPNSSLGLDGGVLVVTRVSSAPRKSPIEKSPTV